MQLWSLWCVGFVFFMAAPCGLAYKIIVPQAGLKPGPLEMKVPTTELPKNFLQGISNERM